MNNKNLDKLITEALAIETEAARESDSIGYMARVLTQATLPHKKVVGSQFTRTNGLLRLTILAPEEIGLPYGTIPRLLLSWLTTEAVRTKEPELILGQNLSNFMSQIGLNPTGGRWGNIDRLREQTKRLFSSSVSCQYDQDGVVSSGMGLNIAKDYCLWWDPKKPGQSSIWRSNVTLSRDFFDEITNKPVPIDIRALNALKRSPLALDIYCWLTYRMSYVKKRTAIPWVALETQFGSNYERTRDFKKKFLDQLRAVLVVYPEAKVESEEDCLILKPSNTHIQKLAETPKTLSHQPVKDNDNLVENRKAHFIYESYKFEKIITIIEKQLEEKEKKKLLKEFQEYLYKRRQHKLIYVKNRISDSERKLKEQLYNFVNSHWHHLLTSIESFNKFTKSRSTKITLVKN